MSRTGTDENRAAQTQLAQEQTAAYQQSMDLTNQYEQQLAALKAKGNPYRSGDYLANEARLVASATGATNKAAQAETANEVGRTGTNSASMQYTKGKIAHDTARAGADTLNSQYANDYANANAWDQYLLGATLNPQAGVNQVYSTATGGRQGALSNLASIGNASWGPFNSLVGAAGQVGSSLAAHWPCWIAAAVFDGWGDRRTLMVRYWLNNVWARESRLGFVVMRVYRAVGRQAAFAVRKSRIMQRALLPLFESALKNARRDALVRE